MQCSVSVSTSMLSEERVLRERRPNAGNMSEILLLMEKTRQDRRQWIKEAQPSITEILQRYPRFQDVTEAVSNWSSVMVNDGLWNVDFLHIYCIILACIYHNAIWYSSLELLETHLIHLYENCTKVKLGSSLFVSRCLALSVVCIWLIMLSVDLNLTVIRK